MLLLSFGLIAGAGIYYATTLRSTGRAAIEGPAGTDRADRGDRLALDETATGAPPGGVRTPTAPAGRTTATAEPGLGDAVGRRPRDLRRFDGSSGELRGHVEVRGDRPFPTAWRLVLGPSTVLAGRAHAEERVLEFSSGEQDFEVTGLPFAGYDVRAEATGLNGRVQPILLDRSSPSAFLNLELVPAGFLEGYVYDPNAVPVEGVRVSLVAQADGTRREARTGRLGRYRFERVLDGPYQLFVGHPDAPLLPGRALRFQAPSMSFPTLTLPAVIELEILVIDDEDNIVAGALVRGSGSGGGWIEGTTDERGRLLERHLLPGRYRIRVEHPGGPELGDERRSFDLRPPSRPDTTRRQEVFRLRP